MITKRKILTVVLLAGAQLVATAPAAVASPVVPDDKQPAWRLELRTNLYRQGATEVRKDMARFRPLCDAEGYPLVGNLASKGITYDVAAFCGEVRARSAKS